MIRNFFGRIFIFLLLINVTGVPYVMHYCGTTGGFSFEACDVCSVSEPVEEAASCCEEEELPEITAVLQIGTTGDNCCTERAIADHSGVDAVSQTHHIILPELSGSPLTPIDVVHVTSISIAQNNYHTHPPGCNKSSIPIVNASLRI